MARSTIFASFLLLLIGNPLRADITPISIFQQVSASGNATACDQGCDLEYGISDSGQSFSQTQTSAQLPPVNVSAGGNVTDFLPAYGRSMNTSGDGWTSSTLTADSVQLDLGGGGQLYARGPLMTGYIDSNAQYQLTFELTAPSLLSLTNDYGTSWQYWNQGIYGPFTQQIEITGNGFQFDKAFNQPYFPFATSFVLNPGVYTLDDALSVHAEGDYWPQGGSAADASLSLEFTPSVPEPSTGPLVLGLLMLGGKIVRQAVTHCRI